MKITLNQFPESINKFIGRKNIWEYQEKKKEYARYIRMATIGKNPKYAKCSMIITLYFKNNRGYDADNYLKILLDGLCKANIIKDDNLMCIRNLQIAGKIDKKNPRIEIDVWEEL